MAIRPEACGRDPAAVLCMLWMHELTQAYQCRCGPPQDAALVSDTLQRLARSKLGVRTALPGPTGPPEQPPLFGDFVRIGVPRHERVVEMVTGAHAVFPVSLVLHHAHTEFLFASCGLTE